MGKGAGCIGKYGQDLQRIEEFAKFLASKGHFSMEMWCKFEKKNFDNVFRHTSIFCKVNILTLQINFAIYYMHS